MAKTTFLDPQGGQPGTLVLAAFLNKIFNTGGGHKHDGGADDGSAGKINLAGAAEVSGLLPADNGGVPTGAVMPFAGSSAPTGWLLCDSSAVSRTTYAALFAVIGTTFGAGDGSTTFNLPGCRGRAVIGAGQGAGLTNRALAATGGGETHQLSVDEMPSHNHIGVGGAGYNGSAFDGLPSSRGSGPSASSMNVTAQGGGQTHNNMQPFIALNYIIKM